MKTAEEVVRAFKENGAEISVEEVQDIGSMINEVAEKLGEENLESVSGGRNVLSSQFAEGTLSGLLGPGYAYSRANPDTKPENTREKVVRCFGIAKGSVMTLGIFLPVTWSAGAIYGAVENKKNKKK